MKLKFLIFLFVPAFAFGQSFNLMTYNIRYDNPSDGNNSWPFRKESLVNQIEKCNPAIFGIQEGLEHQVLYIDSCLSNYSYVGVGRDDGKTKGEYCAIFYDTTQFNVIESSTFWLSKTPDKVSVGWDAALERICTYAVFRHNISGQKLIVFNTHFDHIGKKARRKSAELLLYKIDNVEYSGLPVVLMGDFNDVASSKSIKTILLSMLDVKDVSVGEKSCSSGTFNGFKQDLLPVEIIDFVFVRNLNVNSVKHDDDKRDDGYFFSDHFPVLVNVSFVE